MHEFGLDVARLGFGNVYYQRPRTHISVDLDALVRRTTSAERWTTCWRGATAA